MRFKIDENLPAELAVLFRTSGHDAMTVRDQGLAGGDDTNIAAVCRAEDRALVTSDLDFADIRAYPPEEYKGLIVLRLARQSKRRVLSLCARLMPLLEREQLHGRLWVAEEAELRIRGGDES